MTPPRRLALAVATISLAALSTACGAVGQAVDCNSAANEVTKIATDWSSAITKNATDTAALGEASKTAASKTKELAGKYDGDVAAALNDLASGFESLESGDISKATEFSGKMSGFQSKITAACT
ncbi:hypothetical protein ACFFV7_07675 [Nonomuraea spiralis]|uniref:Uncharacterized protein n=1 Tax=Nonomuraea spiralis TaxID=46182 RepID=A0ABV5I944_9ACTN|nr:hypothetical protein [Nonomuraea spiralis]GGS76638.1 hypothetical protein GCM10010176_019720 [Nonomuraea spiralis]